MEDALNIGVDNTRGLCTCICVSPKVNLCGTTLYFVNGYFPSLTLLHLNQDMFSEELQAVPVELEDVTESSRLTGDH